MTLVICRRVPERVCLVRDAAAHGRPGKLSTPVNRPPEQGKTPFTSSLILNGGDEHKAHMTCYKYEKIWIGFLSFTKKSFRLHKESL